ncbi:hypothetical protein LWI29_005029 [Acer saccharum]|uniref:U1-type domain-containing protein n=1 Tax=Acer saccharum TaxID=4024 RepID=A0AA39V8I8_ACESA|nr:hypothetical protein LWI29_005029 [Acer saccharum]KAK1550022.1 hypothetical protein Q3G72_012474 [Acer saccharum]
MEFKFRAGDDRPPPNLPASSSSTMSFISEQALRANYSSDPNFIRSQIEMYTIQREIEKEKIRLEIIAAENVRRRLLEEEVRRELMMERETAARGSSETGLSTEESHTTQLDSRFPFTHKLDNRLLEDRLAFPESRSLGFGPFGLDMLPPILPQLSDAVTDDNKSALEVNKKGKLIILAKPDPNLCGVKRKAETPPAAPGELPFTNMKKKSKEEWSCALCEVSATSERGLNEHLQGRKHKSKEARLRAQAQKMRNNSTSSHSKESGKQTKVTVGRDTANIEQKMKAEEESGQLSKAEDGSDQKMDGVGLKNKDEKLPNNQVNKNENVVKKNQNAKNRKKKFKFWCAVCQIGAHSAIVMESHKKGRKHLSRLKEKKLIEAAPTITTTNMTIQASPNCTAKGKDVDAVAKEANEKTVENDALVEGAIEKTENDDMVEEINVAVVEEINGETVENDAIGEEKASEKDEMTKESSEEIAGNDARVEEANEKTAEIDEMVEDANEKTAEDDVVVKVAEDDVVAEEANKEVAENDVVAEEANKEVAENDVVVAEESNKEAAENVAGVTDC